jgi:suppressor of ftsI
MKRWRFKLSMLFALSACGGGGGSSGVGGLPPTNPPSSGVTLPSAPVVNAHHGVATADLSVVLSSTTDLPTFVFKGAQDVAPTFNVRPGDRIVINLKNELSGPGMENLINLHFHGLTVSPRAPADDVLTMMAMPGQTLHYIVPIPRSQEPGLYWYHPHIHGETNYQVGLAGMSGAIVVAGLTQRYPQLAGMKEHVIIVRDVQNSPGSGAVRRAKPMDVDQNNNPCGPDPGIHFTVNNVVRPTIRIAPGESQFFRIVNATGHRHLVLQADGLTMQVVALDGYALDVYSKDPATMTLSKYVLPPAGRVEFVLTGPTSGTSELRTLCFNSGPAGDPDPPEILADLRAPKGGNGNDVAPPAVPEAMPINAGEGPTVRTAPDATTSRIVRLTEDSNGFYINGQAFNPDARPMFTVKVGTVEEWNVLNLTEEVHDFHMHQVHFLAQEINGTPLAHPHWTDTFMVPPRIPGANGTFKPGTIQALVDFRNPVIRGMFLFHCHILDHEDGGMMAKIQAQ